MSVINTNATATLTANCFSTERARDGPIDGEALHWPKNQLSSLMMLQDWRFRQN